MTTSTPLVSRRGLGGFAALIGGALMLGSVALDWFESGGAKITGWDTYQTLTDAGRNGFYENNFFDPGFSPFFPGGAIMLAGGLMALIGLALMASAIKGAFRLPGPAAMLLGLLAVLIFIVGIVDLISLWVTGPGSSLISAEYGLYLMTAGAVIGLLGVSLSVGWSRS